MSSGLEALPGLIVTVLGSFLSSLVPAVCSLVTASLSFKASNVMAMAMVMKVLIDFFCESASDSLKGDMQ